MIQIEKLQKTYHAGDTAVHALRGIDLRIDEGDFLAIAGPSGSGKTTLLNIVGCLDSPDEGSVTIGDARVDTLSRKEQSDYRRGNLGFVFQSFNLIPVLTAQENVALALTLLMTDKDEVAARTQAILREVGLEGMEDRRPARLSGGQQQRVAIARALVKEPAIVLADEPTANLDSETGESILELMRALNERHGTTFIFSTHDPMVMRYSRRLVELKDGTIASDRTRDGETMQ